MAKAVRSVDRNQVKSWFSGLEFEVQQSVLDDLSKALESSKEERISVLERELSALRGRSQAGSSAPAARKEASPKKGVKVAPKYRHPATGETWAGRGVHPVWVRDYLKKRGNKLDDLLIDKKAAK
ncbi:MAG: H-NS histone family protein [Hyphomicrobium sp.]|jgi:DNA-binding protein H-NS|uniref:H-NS histone family protein n=1 Tax=Hyphomicrobium sp. TaxID=82 RepID=UPI0025C42E73|nr:H-NS histone family protein [Hyphomicrobium sp.]MBX9862395.1 H-NS histone family protein [Hyphomicrobium sp.]